MGLTPLEQLPDETVVAGQPASCLCQVTLTNSVVHCQPDDFAWLGQALNGPDTGGKFFVIDVPGALGSPKIRDDVSLTVHPCPGKIGAVGMNSSHRFLGEEWTTFPLL